MDDYYNKGWALMKRKRHIHTDKQKEFVFQKFMSGEKTRKKLTPEQIVKAMRDGFYQIK